MFRLLRAWDAERELSPADFQYILSPRDAFSQARIFYEISSDHYHYPDNISCHDVPRRKSGNLSLFSAPDKRRQRGYADNIYDDTQRNIDEGWIIGVDTHAQWDNRRNPFSFDEDSNLVYDCFMDHYHEWFESEVRKAYEKCLNNHNGRKPAPTVKQANYGDAPVQHAQAAKTINSKAAGRLLAAGGIYNGNIEGFHDTAQQLGGDAPAGYDQVMDNKGLIIAGASVAAGLGLGRLGGANEISEISNYSKIPTFESPALKGFTSNSGTLLNAEHAVVDYRKLSTYSLDVTHPKGGHKARVFQSALGYNPTNSDVLASRVQEGILTAPAKVLDANQYGQIMAVDMPILGANGETVIVRSGWIYEPDAAVPRMTTIFVK